MKGIFQSVGTSLSFSPIDNTQAPVYSHQCGWQKAAGSEGQDAKGQMCAPNWLEH